MAWVWPAGLAVLTLAGASGAGTAERSAPGGGAGGTETVDAEMLRDLELLESPDYARTREMEGRTPFLERLRMLENERTREAGPASAPAWVLEPARGSR
jgi:hypothetical protein